MSKISRRRFTRATLAAMGASVLPQAASGDQTAAGTLPTVRWGKHRVTRVLLGHNPIKGQSHYSAELSREMREWFSGDERRGLQLLRRAEQAGINTCQRAICGRSTRTFIHGLFLFCYKLFATSYIWVVCTVFCHFHTFSAC